MPSSLVTTLLVVSLLTTGLSAPVQAQAQTHDPPQLTCSGEDFVVNVDRSVTLFNENTDAVPSPVASLASSNTTEIRITNASQSAYTVMLNDSLQITSVDVGPATESDITVTTNRSTACEVYTAADPVAVAQQAYSDDEITIDGHGVVNQAKAGVVDVAIDIVRWF